MSAAGPVPRGPAALRTAAAGAALALLARGQGAARPPGCDAECRRPPARPEAGAPDARGPPPASGPSRAGGGALGVRAIVLGAARGPAAAALDRAGLGAAARRLRALRDDAPWEAVEAACDPEAAGAGAGAAAGGSDPASRRARDALRAAWLAAGAARRLDAEADPSLAALWLRQAIDNADEAAGAAAPPEGGR